VTYLIATGVDITERINAAEALRHRDNDLSLAVQQAKLSYWKIDLATKRLSWSDFSNVSIGLNLSESSTTIDFFNHIHEQDRQRIFDLLEQIVLNKSAFESDFRVVDNDGHTYWMAVQGKHIWT